MNKCRQSLAAICMIAWGQPVHADVISQTPDEPQSYINSIEVGPFSVDASIYGPFAGAEPPFRKPYGYESVSIEWSPAKSSALVVLSWDYDGYHMLMTSRRMDDQLKSLCWHQVDLGKRLAETPELFWEKQRLNFKKWFESCDALPQGALPRLIAEIPDSAMFSRAFKAMKKAKTGPFIREAAGEFAIAPFSDLYEEEQAF